VLHKANKWWCTLYLFIYKNEGTGQDWH
jgi:hypothetical protein